MKKIDASSDENNSQDGFLPAEFLWRAAQIICQKGIEISSTKAEPGPLEVLGLTIGILRRQKHISRSQFAHMIGCSIEELLVLEAGMLPANDLVQYLPLIIKNTSIPKSILQPCIKQINLK
ncbi:MAG: hypothetical protein HY863_02220 [Chloroflexi bacterium]|nr:hypothetical protein [Chloroflexota bacterium]